MTLSMLYVVSNRIFGQNYFFQDIFFYNNSDMKVPMKVNNTGR